MDDHRDDHAADLEELEDLEDLEVDGALVDGPALPQGGELHAAGSDHADTGPGDRVEGDDSDEPLPDRPVELAPTELVSLDDVHLLDNVRTDVRGIDELAESIRVASLLQYVSMRRARTGADHGKPFELIFGYRRFHAFLTLRDNAREAGQTDTFWDAIPAVVLSVDDDEVLADQLTENLKRANMNPVEQAQAMQRLIDAFGWTQKKVAAWFEVDRTQVSKRLTLLRQPERVVELVAEGKITASHAEEIARVKDPVKQEELAEMAASRELRVDKVRAYANKVAADEEQPVVDEDAELERPDRPLETPDAPAAPAVAALEGLALRDDLDDLDLQRANLFVLLRCGNDLELLEHLSDRLFVGRADLWDWIVELTPEQVAHVRDTLVRRWLRAPHRLPTLPRGLREDLADGVETWGQEPVAGELPADLDALADDYDQVPEDW